jgi:hypothetical protein
VVAAAVAVVIVPCFGGYHCHCRSLPCLGGHRKVGLDPCSKINLVSREVSSRVVANHYYQSAGIHIDSSLSQLALEPNDDEFAA